MRAINSGSSPLKKLLIILTCFLIFQINCKKSSPEINPPNALYLIILGITQDGGYPQAGTKRSEAWDDPKKRKHVTCLAIVDPETSERWMIDVTPDFREQLHFLDEIAPMPGTPGLSGIFLTHAHIGHYTGLMHLGREAIGVKNMPVYAMPGMCEFLTNNGPWDLLVKLKNIELYQLSDRVPLELNEKISITPFLVPHRAEYTETIGYKIEGPGRSVLFIPDIDKWEDWDRWGTRIEDLIQQVDIAYLDGTFYADGEIPGRSMAEIPHPFIEESMKRFGSLPVTERNKIRFIHSNHTNPALIKGSDAQKKIEQLGFRVAKEFEIVHL